MNTKRFIAPLAAAGFVVLQCFAFSPAYSRHNSLHQQDDDNWDEDEEEIYYGELIDSATLSTWTPDSVKHFADSIMGLIKEDSIFFDNVYTDVPDSIQHGFDSTSMRQVRLDSIARAEVAFKQWFDSLSKKEQRYWIKENITLPALIHRYDSIMARKDSIKAYKDSVAEATPRILETSFLPKSDWYKRIVVMTNDRKFGDIHTTTQDTSYNYFYNDYPFLRNDVNATWLGVAGTATQTYDFHKRKEEENAIFFTPYTAWTHNPDDLPMYNTKTPYTELGYYGTLLSGDKKEEINLHVLTTQNITPAANITFSLNKYGGAGDMANSKTGHYDLAISSNYLGKKYIMHAGWLHNRVIRTENGGFIDNKWIRDTTVDAKEIAVNLTSAETQLQRNTVFLNHKFRINFGNDSLTTAFIGHSLDWSLYDKTYTDKISDATGREFYHNNFFISPNSSSDKMRTMKLDNKVFLSLQPWKETSIVSKIDAGIGDKLLNYTDFYKDTVSTSLNKAWENNLYVYGGAKGMIKKYFNWNADAGFFFAGHQAGDFYVNAALNFNIYPFRKARDLPISIGASFHTDITTPDHYEQKLYHNHFKWNNNFTRSNTTTIGGHIDIPYWKLRFKADYSLLTGKIYFGADGNPVQNPESMSVLGLSLEKNFSLWNVIHLDNKLLCQFSSNQLAVPLPVFSMNLRWYVQFFIVKNVLQMQLGANCLYNTEWHMPGYNPNVGVFYNQQTETYGNCPYIDVFLNLQWKRACIFIKGENINQGWPREKNMDYFSGHGYIHTQRVIKFGITWPFYILPKSRIHGDHKHSDSASSSSKKK